jgi:hypothetical protein
MIGILFSITAALHFLAAPPAKELPPLNRQGLITLIESGQGRIRQARAVFFIRYGSVAPSGDPATAPFVPDPSGYLEAAESAFDTGSRSVFLHHERPLPGKDDVLTDEFLYDGKTGWHLGQLIANPKIWVAEITIGWPREMGPDRGTVLRADEITCHPILAESLAAVIRRAHEIDIAPDAVRGHPAYKVTMSVLTDALDNKGRTTPGKKLSRHRVWLAPDRGMLPLRVEALPLVVGSKPGTSMPDDEGRVFFEPSDFRQIGPDVWWPYKVRKCLLPLNARPIVVEMTFETVAINEKASVPTRLDFPVGTHVTDLVKGLKYVQAAGGQIRRPKLRPVPRRESSDSRPAQEPKHPE